jgi:hypothetical protein
MGYEFASSDKTNGPSAAQLRVCLEAGTRRSQGESEMSNRTSILLATVALVLTVVALLPPGREQIAWMVASLRDQPESYANYLARWPDGRHADRARQWSTPYRVSGSIRFPPRTQVTFGARGRIEKFTLEKGMQLSGDGVESLAFPESYELSIDDDGTILAAKEGLLAQTSSGKRMRSRPIPGKTGLFGFFIDG